jgi:hypothetical protein
MIDEAELQQACWLQQRYFRLRAEIIFGKKKEKKNLMKQIVSFSDP